MENLSKVQEKEFIWEWLHRLCLKGITSINLGHDPGLRGMMAVTIYLEKKTSRLLWNDGMKQTYVAFFRPDTQWHYPKLYKFLMQSSNVVDPSFDIVDGDTFDISVYARECFSCCALSSVSALAEELAKVFAKAYKSFRPRK